MTASIRKFFGFTKKPDANDDFYVFMSGKSADKVKIMRQILREATREQQQLLKKYKEIQLTKANS